MPIGGIAIKINNRKQKLINTCCLVSAVKLAIPRIIPDRSLSQGLSPSNWPVDMSVGTLS